MQQQVIFPSGTVNYIFESSFEELWQTYDKEHAVIVTNEHIARLYAPLLKGFRTLTLPPLESSKDMRTIESLARHLLEMEATRNALLVGLGGGVITDITGFLASVYMRGVSFGFVPTTLLGMADAAVGGKNGVNLGLNKNLLGTIAQPEFILYDIKFLESLPNAEWSNGFAEIIKYACIFDEQLFEELSKNSITFYKENDGALISLIKRCVAWKNKTVIDDEKEAGTRKLLNFGHTAAHAIENLYELPHGKAVAIGMVIACLISEQVTGLSRDISARVKSLLERYNLPVSMALNPGKAMDILRMDKKRKDDTIEYIVLEKIGKAVVHALPLNVIDNALNAYESHN